MLRQQISWVLCGMPKSVKESPKLEVQLKQRPCRWTGPSQVWMWEGLEEAEEKHSREMWTNSGQIEVLLKQWWKPFGVWSKTEEGLTSKCSHLVLSPSAHRYDNVQNQGAWIPKISSPEFSFVLLDRNMRYTTITNLNTWYLFCSVLRAWGRTVTNTKSLASWSLLCRDYYSTSVALL